VLLGSALEHAHSANVTSEISLGILCPLTSVSQGYIAVVAAFDLDLQKNFDTDVRTRFGPPMVEVPNLHPDLRVRPLLGDSASSSEARWTALRWMTDTSAGLPIHGVIGALFSSVTQPLAGLTGLYEVPQISYGATAAALSDSSLYPFFLRTVASDNIQAQAWWAWFQAFEVPAVAMVYTSEAYGAGFFQALFTLFAQGGLVSRLHGIDVPLRDEPAQTQACNALLATGTRFSMLALIDTGTLFMHIMEEKGLLYGNMQVLATESVNIRLREGLEIQPTKGYPAGFMRFVQNTEGPRYSDFEAMWKMLRPDDLYGAYARQRYGLDSIPLENATSSALELSDFADTSLLDTFGMPAALIDAAYAYVFAVNHLLHQQVPLEDMKGLLLKEALLNVTFEGISGFVSFDEHGDREINITLENAWYQDNQSSIQGQDLQRIGTFRSSALSMEMDPRWAPSGEASPVAPEHLVTDCGSGFEFDTTTNLCVPCTPGIGCGFREEDGIVLGVASPLTSLSQTFLACIASFDLDFKKNFDPELRARLGPPIINVSNLHPDLKLKLQVGTSHTTVSIGMNTAFDWMLGSGDFSKVAGMVFGYFSFIAIPVASGASAFETPMLGFGSGSRDLSDKSKYPYFLRVIAPDKLRGGATWRWMEIHGIPSAVFFYTQESLGEGYLDATLAAATLAGGSNLIVPVGTPDWRDVDDVVLQQLSTASISIKQTKIRFVIIGMPFGIGGATLYAFEQEGMLYGPDAVQMLGPPIDQAQEYIPSQSYPIGFQGLFPLSQGALYPQWWDLWQKLTLEDCYGLEARDRYMLDRMRVALSDATSAPLTEDSFKDPLPDNVASFVPLLFDALYTYVHAINDLLNAGVAAKDIHGPVLMEQMWKTDFEGISGKVAFDVEGDRDIFAEEFYNCRPPAPSDGIGGCTLDYMGLFIFKGGLNEEGLFQPDGGEVGDPMTDMVWVTGLVGPTLPLSLLTCEAGTSWNTGEGRCIQCSIGSFSEGGDINTQCRSCQPGSTSSGDSQSCVPCPGGTYTSLDAGNNCTLCPSGSFALSPGSSACELCPVGRYATEAGALLCTSCGQSMQSKEAFTTMQKLVVNGFDQFSYVAGAEQASYCGCDIGYRSTSGGECETCTEGMVCPGLGTVLIDYGYFSEAQPDISVYECHGDEGRCAGGPPGQTCAQGRRGLTCAECKDMMTPRAGGECVECEGTDKVPFALLVLAFFAIVASVYRTMTHVHSKPRRLTSVIAVAAVGHIATAMQQLAVIQQLSLPWTRPFKNILELASALHFDFEVFRLGCVGSPSALHRYMLKLCILLVAVAWIVILHVFLTFIWKALTGAKEAKPSERWLPLFSAVAGLLMIFYISVTMIVLEPMHCQNHPNGKWTLAAYNGIICWETTDHASMLALCLVTFVTVPIGFLAMLLVIVTQLPDRMQRGDANFIKAVSFLFFSFQPSKQWFLIPSVLKNLLIASCIMVPEIVLTLVLIFAVLLGSLCASLVIEPWRVRPMGVLDCFLNLCMITVVVLTTFFIEESDKNPEALSWLCTICVCAGFACTPFGLGYVIWRRFIRKVLPYTYFLCHHKAGAGAYTRLLKMYLLETPRLPGDVFIDSDNLHNLDHLLDYVRSDTETLLVLASSDVFSRVWCLGEITTARHFKVPTIVIGLPGYKLPDDEFISSSIDGRGLPNVDVLIQSGLGLSMVRQSMRWICDQQFMEVPPMISQGLMTTVVKAIRAKNVPRAILSASTLVEQRRSDQRRTCLLLYDSRNMEALAACHVLQKMLLPIMSNDAELLPDIVDGLEALPAETAMFVVMCTNGIFDNATVLAALGHMFMSKSVPLPLVVDNGFRFPPQDTMGWLQKSGQMKDVEETARSASGIAMLFKEIATEFQPNHSSIQVLEANSKAVCHRISSCWSQRMKGSSTKVSVASSSPIVGAGSGTSGRGSSVHGESVALTSTKATAIWRNPSELPERVDKLHNTSSIVSGTQDVAMGYQPTELEPECISRV